MSHIVQAAKTLARTNIADATLMLMKIGMTLNDAAHYLLSVLRRNRVAT